MIPSKLLVIGDLHGNLAAFQQLMQAKQSDDFVVFLGDLIDRGPYGFAILKEVMKMVEKGEAVCLKGNHEDIFLQWYHSPISHTLYYIQDVIGGLPTLDGALALAGLSPNDYPTGASVAKKLAEVYAKEIDFLKNLPHYFEWNEYLFVHAGISPTVVNLQEQDKEVFYWIRDEFIYTPHQYDKVVVFGHTPTQNMGHPQGTPWISPCGKKIGIDGGVFLNNGAVNGLRLAKNEPIMVVRYDTGSKQLSEYFLPYKEG